MTQPFIELERAAQETCVGLELANWSVLRMSGSDRKAFLHSFSTNDITGLAVGGVREAFVTNVKGRILGHILVLDEPEHLTLLAVPGSAEKLVPHLQMYSLGRDVEVRNVTQEVSVVCLIGPLAANVLAQFQKSEIQLCADNASGVTVLGEERVLCRYDLLALPTWLLFVPQAEAAALRGQLVEQGATWGTETLFQLLRIAAGFPWHGVDLSDEHLAQEAARTSRTISFRKGCYLGQEPIARLDAMGHTNRELRLLNSAGCHEIPVGTPVLAAGIEIGRITSSACSELRNETVSLAMLKVKQATAGAELEIGTQSVPIRAVVRSG